MPRRRPFGLLSAVDRRLIHRLTRAQHVRRDLLLRALSFSANHSKLWILIAGMMSLTGGRAGRRAAIRGVIGIAIASATVNGPIKLVARRERPEPGLHRHPPPIPLPASSSFPSGHTASAVAYAVGTARDAPGMFLLLGPLAAIVGYSRVRLRVHYPLDVLAGAMIGLAAGMASEPVLRIVREWWDSHRPALEALRAKTKQVVLITNPASGRHARLDDARTALHKASFEIVAEIPIKEIERLPEVLEKAGDPPPIVVAAGGDGTVGLLANHVVNRPLVMGVIPLGTSNDFARSLRIPMQIGEAVRLLAVGKVATIDVGRIVEDGREPIHFVHAATAGLNVSFAKFATRADLRAQLGRLTYALAATRALRERRVFRCRVSFDSKEETLSLTNLSVINAPVFGGALGLQLPGSDADDRALDVLLVEHLPLRRLVPSAALALVGVRRPIRGIRTLRVSQLRATPSEPIEVALDGEVRGRIPATFEVVGEGLRVITPAAFQDRDDS